MTIFCKRLEEDGQAGACFELPDHDKPEPAPVSEWKERIAEQERIIKGRGTFPHICFCAGAETNQWFRGSGIVEWMIRLVQQTGMVLGIMACATGAAVGAVKLTEKVKRLPGRKKSTDKK